MSVEVKVGSRWTGSEHDRFSVVNVVELDGHVWVHYRKETESEDSAREYKCYKESFLHRFKSLIN